MNKMNTREQLAHRVRENKNLSLIMALFYPLLLIGILVFVYGQLTNEANAILWWRYLVMLFFIAIMGFLSWNSWKNYLKFHRDHQSPVLLIRELVLNGIDFIPEDEVSTPCYRLSFTGNVVCIVNENGFTDKLKEGYRYQVRIMEASESVFDIKDLDNQQVVYNRDVSAL